MLVLANGAFKSGSTWLWAILKKTNKFSALPDECGWGQGETNNWFKPGKRKAFLESGLYHQTDYLTKSHYFSKRIRDELLACEDVYIFNIKRDVKDSLVSHYYHLIRQNKLNEELVKPKHLKRGFSNYYWRLGRYKAQQLEIYHSVWDVPSPKIYVSSFERLKNDYEAEVRRIGNFLGLKFSAQDIARLKESTSIKNMQKEKGMDKLEEHKRFYRKGLIGEWKDYFDDDMLADVGHIEQSGLGKVDMLKYHGVFAALDLKRRWTTYRRQKK